MIIKKIVTDTAAHLQNDNEYRAKAFSFLNLAVNMAYVIIKLIPGIMQKSALLIGFGVYYLLLSVMQFFLVEGIYRNNVKQDMRSEWKLYLLTGVLQILFIIKLSLFVYSYMKTRRATIYPGYMIYFMCAYVFYCLVMAIINLIRFRKMSRPFYGRPRQWLLRKRLLPCSLYRIPCLRFSEKTILPHFGIIYWEGLEPC